MSDLKYDYIVPSEAMKRAGISVKYALHGKVQKGDEFTIPGHFRPRTWRERLWFILGSPKHRVRPLRVFTVVQIANRYVKASYER
jgi:hypothetical protein